MTGRRRIDVVTSQEPPSCPRCGQEGLLLARVPYGWTNAAGTAVDGRTGVVLCAACDAQVPGADALITWFHVYGSVEPDHTEEFARLLVAWAEQVSVPLVDEQQLAAESDLWRRGEL
ncbi:DUF6300 family protein [Nonomuraea sp. 3N208]|uniref:DUF6300 family protein n=1 Tax=Nonomuraea sp. 3N208 TaxID=3457421 RepID=UPI003FD426A8